MRQSALKLAISSDTFSAHLAGLLALQRAEEPDVPVVLRSAPSPELLQGLEDGRYDAGLMMATEEAPASSHLQLWRDELAVAVPARSHLLAHALIPLEALSANSVVRWCPHTCGTLSRWTDALIGSDAARPVDDVRVTCFEWMATLVAAGYGVGIAPRSRILQARDWGVVMRPIADGPYPITTLLHLAPESAPAVERFATRAQKIAERQTDRPLLHIAQ